MPKGENRVRRSKVPILEWRPETYIGWFPLECELVAQSAESQDPASEFVPLQPHGRGVQLHQGVQEPRPQRRRQGSPRLDDQLASLVACRLWSLRALLHPHGMAQRRNLSYCRRAWRRRLGIAE